MERPTVAGEQARRVERAAQYGGSRRSRRRVGNRGRQLYDRWNLRTQSSPGSELERAHMESGALPERREFGYPAGLVAVSADDAYVMGATTQRPSIDHWHGPRWRSVPLGRAGHLLRAGVVGYRTQGLTVTSDGSIAALATGGLADRANFLWLRCQH